MKYEVKDSSNDRGYFTIVPNYILNHSSAIDQALYLQMKRVAGDNGLCFITQKHLCEKLGIGKDKLRTSLQYLTDHKWIEFVGTTDSKTKPINTYKINDIWKLNTDHYEEKKIKSETAQSFGEKDKTQKTIDKTQIRPMIRPETAPLRRTNIKEEPLRKPAEAVASGVKGVKSMSDILANHVLPEKKKGGATYQWQDTAVRMWKKLELSGNPSAGWFKLFKANTALAERACSWVSDSGGDDLERLTYWAYNQFKKYGKINYAKVEFQQQSL